MASPKTKKGKLKKGFNIKKMQKLRGNKYKESQKKRKKK